MEKILDLVGEFDLDLRHELEKATEGELKDAVDSVVSNRHQIAHGQDVGINFSTIRQYWEKVIRVIEQIEKQFPV